jgi:predicted Zn-dependent protease
MNEKTAKMIAGLVNGTVVDSGGSVFIVEVDNPGLTTLCLGNGGWWIEDGGGNHIIDGENLD